MGKTLWFMIYKCGYQIDYKLVGWLHMDILIVLTKIFGSEIPTKSFFIINAKGMPLKKNFVINNLDAMGQTSNRHNITEARRRT